MQNLLFSPRIRLAFVLPAITCLAVVIPLIWFLTGGLLRQGSATQLRNTLPVISGLMAPYLSLEDRARQARVAALAPDDRIRITLIDAAGRVLADSSRSWVQVQEMENHADRPEIIGARAAGEGSSVRRSSTTGIEYVYVAKAMTDPHGDLFFLRLAQPLPGLEALRHQLALVLLLSTAAALTAMMAWLWWLQRKVSRVAPEFLQAARHMEAGNFSYRIDISPRTELGRIGRFLNRIATQADERIRDLTIQREHLLTVVSSMREGVLVTDAEGFSRLANPAFRRLFGIRGEVEDLTPLEITRQPRIEDLIVSTLTSGEPQLAEIELAEPTPRHVALATTSLGDGVGAVLVARDVSDLVLLGQMRRDFVANVSHELKTPLTAIRGYAETLRDGASEDRDTAARFLDRILQQCTRLQALLEDLLTLSRLESLENPADHFAPVRLNELLEECLAAIAPQIGERRIQLRLDAEPVPEIAGDADGLERLMINLLDNAVKYNRVGGSVTARLKNVDREIVFEVSDTGIGIPNPSLSRVFERFYRVDKGRSREEGGTGLGLAIVKHIAQLHAGRVVVESRLGQGSMFRVHLPLDQPD